MRPILRGEPRSTDESLGYLDYLGDRKCVRPCNRLEITILGRISMGMVRGGMGAFPALFHHYFQGKIKGLEMTKAIVSGGSMMTHLAWFIAGVFVGGAIGFMICALLSAGAEIQHHQDLDR